MEITWLLTTAAMRSTCCAPVGAVLDPIKTIATAQARKLYRCRPRVFRKRSIRRFPPQFMFTDMSNITVSGVILINPHSVRQCFVGDLSTALRNRFQPRLKS